MALLNATPASAALLRTATGLSVGAAAPAGGPGFGKVLADVSAAASTVDVRQGDTLIGLVKAHCPPSPAVRPRTAASPPQRTRWPVVPGARPHRYQPACKPATSPAQKTAT